MTTPLRDRRNNMDEQALANAGIATAAIPAYRNRARQTAGQEQEDTQARRARGQRFSLRLPPWQCQFASHCAIS